MLAFVLTGDVDHIHVGYAPSLFPADLAMATPFDDKVVILVGDDLNLAVTITMPDAAFCRTADVLCQDLATILGATGHGAAPPVYMRGPHGGAVSNTDEFRV